MHFFSPRLVYSLTWRSKGRWSTHLIVCVQVCSLPAEIGYTFCYLQVLPMPFCIIGRTKWWARCARPTTTSSVQRRVSLFHMSYVSNHDQSARSSTRRNMTLALVTVSDNDFIFWVSLSWMVVILSLRQLKTISLVYYRQTQAVEKPIPTFYELYSPFRA